MTPHNIDLIKMNSVSNIYQLNLNFQRTPCYNARTNNVTALFKTYIILKVDILLLTK